MSEKVQYTPGIFDKKNIEDAKKIILTNEKDISSEQRWESETPYLLASISENISITKDSLILDFGCGIGRLSKKLIEKFGCKVVGVDISASMRAHAKEYVNSENFSIVPPSEFRNMILRGVRFDGAIAIWVLQHCIDPLADIVMIRAGLKKTAPFYVLNNIKSAIPTNKGWRTNKTDIFSLLNAFFTLKTRTTLPKEAGNENISTHTFEALFINTKVLRKKSTDKEVVEFFKKGVESYNKKMYDEAIDIFKKILEKEQNNEEAYANLGVVYRAKGDPKEAIKHYQKAIQLNQLLDQNYYNLANVYKDLKNYKEAINILIISIKLNPLNLNTYNNLGMVYESAGDIKRAILSYKEAVRANPKFAKAVNNIGVALYKQQEYYKSAAIFNITLDTDKNYNEVYSNLGAALNKAKRYDEAIVALERAIEKMPNHSGAYTNLGNVYNKIYNYRKGAALHEKSIELDPNGSYAYSNVGNSYKHLGYMQKAITSYKKAIEINPDFENAHFDLATVLLAKKEFEEGFKEYEWRFKKYEMKTHIIKHRHIFSKPMFTNGTDIKGKIVLVHSEQGFGDSIMYARFLPKLKALGCTLALECRDELKELFSTIKVIDILVGRDEQKTPSFDYHLPIMSLPFALKINSEKEFLTSSYLKAKKDDSFKLDGDKIKIGLCWSASKTGESYDGKVFDLANFDALIKESKVEIYSLQKGYGTEQIAENNYENNIIDLSDELTNFSKTASLMKQLDLVISSDTSVAHLAGAIGVKTYTLLQKYPDWRWTNKGETSYLYKSMKLFRQKQDRNWESVFQSLFARLNKEFKLKLTYNI